MRAAVLLAATAALAVEAGCTTYAGEVERIRQGLIGMSPRALSGCLPVPAEVQPDDEVEVVIYRWSLDPDLEPVSVGPLPTADPTLGEQRRRRETGDFLMTGERPRDAGYCEISVEIAEGVVQQVRIEGRESSGLNRDAACLMEARRCVPPASSADR